ncbi:MAG: metallophosphoesterase [Desulfobacteraceae bacterium]|nr:MAG: metallophosphoesterase [Desulfobacteraceae bacterium]
MMFLIIAILALTLIYGLFGIRILRPARLGRKIKILGWATLSVCYAALPMALVFRFNWPDNPMTIPLSWFAYATFGFFTLTFCAILLRDGILVIGHGIRKGLQTRIKPFYRTGVPGKAQVPDDPSRRVFLLNSTNAAILGVSGSLAGYGLAHARQVPRVLDVDVPLANLPNEFEGFRILQISDLHVSMTIRRDYVQKVVDRANGQTPDMVVFTGDLADGHVDDLRGESAPLAQLEAPFGKYFVTGNHEYYSGVAGWLHEISRCGFVPLLNEHRVIRRNHAQMVLAGITDYRASQIVPHHASDPVRALAGAPGGLPRIMLAHQPKSVFQAEPSGVDLLICGHTHGGQYIPWNYMVPLDQPYVHGLHRHGRSLIYVSRGTGYWGPPIRIGAPSEITVLRLVRART